ncbi:MAG: hypothetical protein ACERKD_04395 [Prolixibacteraceae bacterium]
MKKYTLLFTALILFSCIFNDDDLPNQFTSVEGYVTDYYSEKSISDLPLVVNNKYTYCIFDCKYNNMDTLYTNKEGHYYFEFYNDSVRNYNVQVMQTENYVKSISTKIFEGEKNTINFPFKPYKTLNLNFYNKNKIFNGIFVHFYNDDKDLDLRPSEDLTGAQFKLIPETENEFYINLYHLTTIDGVNKVDTGRSEYYKFYSGINDTTITYTY